MVAAIVMDRVCEDCGMEPVWMTCVDCGADGAVTDCGHQEQPRPIAADECGKVVCDECYADRR